MTVLRLIGTLFLIAAVIALTSDLSRTGPDGTPSRSFASLYKHWSDFAPQTLTNSQMAVVSRTHPLVWDLGIRPVLLLPAWLSLGGIGAAAAYFGRRRRRVEVFIN